LQNIGQTLIYLLIGLPVVFGIYWRYSTRAHILRAARWTATVFGIVAVGLVIYHYNDSARPLESYPGFVVLEEAVTRWTGVTGDSAPHDAAPRGHRHAALRGNHGSLVRVADRPQGGYARLVTAAFVVVLFCAVGALTAALGPILAGYTITMALNAYFHGGTLQGIFLWRQFFELFDINSTVLQATALISGSLIGAGGSLLPILSRHPAPPAG
jgi:hypothetical protein